MKKICFFHILIRMNLNENENENWRTTTQKTARLKRKK